MAEYNVRQTILLTMERVAIHGLCGPFVRERLHITAFELDKLFAIFVTLRVCLRSPSPWTIRNLLCAEPVKLKSHTIHQWVAHVVVIRMIWPALLNHWKITSLMSDWSKSPKFKSTSNFYAIYSNFAQMLKNNFTTLLFRWDDKCKLETPSDLTHIPYLTYCSVGLPTRHSTFCQRFVSSALSKWILLSVKVW